MIAGRTAQARIVAAPIARIDDRNDRFTLAPADNHLM